VRPLRIGHRGAPRLAPENTLASFEKALASPHTDAVELDVHSTHDGRVAVIHDDKLERTTHGKGFVSERSAHELAALGVPLLDEVLDLVKAHGKRAFVELKLQPRRYAALAEHTLALVHEKKADEHVVIISFDHETLHHAKHAAPHVAFGALCGQRIPRVARYVKEYLGVDWWLPGAIGEVDVLGFFSEHRALDHASIEECRSHGIKTAVWTVNHPEMMSAMTSLGVDGVISDDLDLLGRLA
jgi:glycerophosphoryl diester phosphodiesterase